MTINFTKTTRIFIKIFSATIFFGVLFSMYILTPKNSPISVRHQPTIDKTSISEKRINGILGGVPVSIPWYFVELLELNGDPGWGKGKKQEFKNGESVIRSFGFYVKYPEMTGISSDEILLEKKQYYPRNTPWLRVGITSGDHYPGIGFLNRLTTNTIGDESGRKMYEKQSENFHGLQHYTPTGFDKLNQRPFREHENSDDLYIFKENGEVKAFIKCSNRKIKAAPCQHIFDMNPLMTAEISISYRREKLPEWNKFQKSAEKLINEFKINSLESRIQSNN